LHVLPSPRSKEFQVAERRRRFHCGLQHENLLSAEIEIRATDNVNLQRNILRDKLQCKTTRNKDTRLEQNATRRYKCRKNATIQIMECNKLLHKKIKQKIKKNRYKSNKETKEYNIRTED